MDRRKVVRVSEVSKPKPLNRRAAYSRYAVLGCFLLAGASQAKLQIVEKESTIKKATDMKRYVLTQDEPAKRGEILARDGEPLARDDNVSDLTIDFMKCPNTEPFWIDLSKATGIPATQLTQFADQAAASHYKVRSRTWPKAVRQSDWTAINAVRSKWRADGVSRVAGGYREYPLAGDASCLVGVIRPRFITIHNPGPEYDAAVRENGLPEKGKFPVADGLTGLEKSQDKLLRGKDGKRVGVTDRNGQFLPMRIESQVPKQDGKNLTLTIDRDLQSYAAEVIKNTVAESHAESGVAVIEDPKTGDILAIANYPSFEPYSPDGNYGSLGDHGGLNQAYQSCLEPGSMFKILTLGKALDAGVIHMNDTFFCPGEKVVVPHAKAIKCALEGGKRAHGMIDPVHAIAKSCNIWAATWARQIGYKPFIKYLGQLGLFNKPDIGVPYTAKALFNRNDPAKQLQLANLGFGQSINITAMSLIGAFSTLANGGVRVPPRLIEKVGDQTLAPEKGVSILSNSACQNVIKGMVATMEDPSGTGKSLRIPGYQIAGKTGTAQKMGSKDDGHVSNFVGFIPAYHPKAVVLVMINKPQGLRYYGAEIAGPAFKSIAQEVIRKFQLRQTEAIVVKPKKIEPVVSQPDEEQETETLEMPAPRKGHARKSKRTADDA